MKYLFDFGISQEDANIELNLLEIKDGDRILCIAGAGEVPLNIMAKKNVSVKAVDISLNQIYLSKLKLISSMLFDPDEAAGFLGFLPSDKRKRDKLFRKSTGLMNSREKEFWNSHIKAIENGIINSGRFEKYISVFNGTALHLIGKKKLLKLMEFDCVHDRQNYFDNKINSKLLKALFELTFNPKLYKNRAVSEKGLQNAADSGKAEFFFERFRDFCTATPARENYYLQYFLFNRILFPEAMPEYISEPGMKRIRKNYDNINFANISYFDALVQNNGIKFNKFHLSNIADWMNRNEFRELAVRINTVAERPYKISSRYLYASNFLSPASSKELSAEYDFGSQATGNDRFPFYNLITISSL